MKKRVLVVDDDPQVLRVLRRNLTARDYEVLTATDGEEALDQAAENEPDVVILDLVMPGCDGLEFTRRFREWSQAPIIILSAHGEEKGKVAALDMGADDFVTKPFSIEELLARIRSVLRRAGAAAEQARTGPTFTAGDLHVDFHRRLVTVRGKEVRLTPTEYDLLKYMVTNADRVLTHNMLLKAVWGNRYGAEPEYLRVFVSQIRRKLEDDPSQPRYIITEPGVGYRFRSE
ncbi:MAG: response regulator transcription factor [Armatimonadota bacterium]|nr:response regulator transcription factor [Armatimonadota bacterium]